jgi:hypothetical protein
MTVRIQFAMFIDPAVVSVGANAVSEVLPGFDGAGNASVSRNRFGQQVLEIGSG